MDDAARPFDRPPFFVLGCVRSGTTMLRRILERHPALVCPEETHLFRWPHPFGTPDYRNAVIGNATLRRHREIDGIDEDAFAAMLDRAPTRRALIEAYMAAYRARRKPAATRWFEKSPQNVYGLGLILGLFPEARVLHIVRHPLDVAASLKLGKIVKVASPVGAANYWLEAVLALARFRDAAPDRVWQVRYEDFTADPLPHLRAALAFLGEPFDAAPFADLGLAPKSHAGQGVLTAADIARIWEICGETAAGLGYRCWAAPVPAADAPAGRGAAAQAGVGKGGVVAVDAGAAAAGERPAGEQPAGKRPSDETGAGVAPTAEIPAGPRSAGEQAADPPRSGELAPGRQSPTPESAEPESARAKSAEPESAEPESAEPESAEPESVGPDSAGRDRPRRPAVAEGAA